MGIRVYCPNGHKLNIKVAQAGKRGICPHCGVKFVIPASDNTTESDDSDKPVSTLVDVETDSSGSEECISASESEGATDILPGPSPENTGETPVAPIENTGETPVAPRCDPLAEVPEATWYVRPPSGGQFGPAQADVMRTWLAEGRVTDDSLVWREGWQQWVLASEVFVDRAMASEASGATVGSPVEWTEPVEPSEQAAETAVLTEATRDDAPKPKETAPEVVPPIKVVTEPNWPSGFARRGRQRRSIQLVVWLSVTVVVLIAVLVWILNRS